MATTRSKSFAISDPQDLERIDNWWAALLRKGAKEILTTEWVANGDLSWSIRVFWTPVDSADLSFNVCMPAYASFSVDDLTDLLSAIEYERAVISQNLKLLSRKVEDWELIEVEPSQAQYEETDSDGEIANDFDVDPSLSYAAKLDVVDKLMASEFLWPNFKNMKRALLMCDARIAEVKKEIEYRGDSSYTVVHVDRGMLRESFIEQLGYDNKWLFATEDELFEEEDETGTE